MRTVYVIRAATVLAALSILAVEIHNPTLIRMRCGPMYDDQGFQSACRIELGGRIRSLVPSWQPTTPIRQDQHPPPPRLMTPRHTNLQLSLAGYVVALAGA